MKVSTKPEQDHEADIMGWRNGASEYSFNIKRRIDLSLAFLGESAIAALLKQDHKGNTG